MEVRQKTEQLRGEKEQLNLQLTPLVNKAQSLQAQIENLQQEIEATEGKTGKLGEEISQHQERKRSIEQELHAASTEK